MRDKNLNLKQFYIQLEKEVKRSNPFDDKFLTRPVFVTPTRLLDNQVIGIKYPKDFRLLRTLSIYFWFFPEELHWRIRLDLENFTYSQLNKKQILELRILQSSKENMIKYLYDTKRYSSFEIFGNFLRNDLKDLQKNLKFYRIKYSIPREPIRRRGYKDKGSRRPSHLWLEQFDFSFTEQQNVKEKENFKLNKLIQRILSIIEKQRFT